jgi:GMP synthase-like glutamine amidotransferase
MRNKGETTFLLRKKPKTQKYATFQGKLNTLDDPSIIYSCARKLWKKTAGLLSRENIKAFLDITEAKEASGDIGIVAPVDIQCQQPQRLEHPYYGELLSTFCYTKYQYQIPETKTACYFVEIPAVDIKILNECSQGKGFNFEFSSQSLENILGESGTIDSSLSTLLNNKHLQKYMTEYLINANEVPVTKRYAMFFVEPKVVNCKFDSLFYANFKKHGEHWQKFAMPEMHHPTEKDLKEFSGILIPGSSCHTYDNPEWQQAMEEIIKKCIVVNPSVRILGVCYGGQTVAQCFGGRVEKMNNSFIRGSEPLSVNDTLFELEWLKNVKLSNPKREKYVISESHGDHIAALPSNAVLHASSARTKVEVFTIGDNILGYQGHPEYNEQWTAGVLYKKNKEAGKDFKAVYDEAISNFFPQRIEQEDIMLITFSFLKYLKPSSI